jgi:predicted transcriptional regulator
MIARTQADTFAEEERLMKILSPEELEELKATSDKGPSFFRKLEIRRGYSLPGLSYTPRAK